MAAFALVLIVGLAAGVVGGVVGTGSSIMLLPVLVWTFGAPQAVPIMAVAAVMGNVARAAAWWRCVNWRAFLAYGAAAAPATVFGARTLLHLSPALINLAVGLFFIVIVIPARHWLRSHSLRLSLPQSAVAGASIGFLTGLMLSTGPLSVPAFAAYGLLKGALLSTEATTSLIAYSTKVVTLRDLGALPLSAFLEGMIVGSTLMLGAFLGKAIVLRMNTSAFEHLLDAMMLCSGLSLVLVALQQLL
jgi:uncharacterized protein